MEITDNPFGVNAAPPGKPSIWRRRGLLALVMMSLLVIGIGVTILVSPTPASGPRFKWLTTQQRAQAAQPGRWTALEFRLMRWAGPMGRWLPLRPRLVLFNSMAIGIDRVAARHLELGRPAAELEGKARGWVLSPDQLRDLEQWIKHKATPKPRWEFAPRVSAAEEMRTQAFSGSPSGAGGGLIPIGIEVDSFASSLGRNFNVITGICWTETNTAPEVASSSIRTNINIGCQALVPNGGALLLEDSSHNDGTNYWFIFSPVEVNAQGKAVKRL